MKPQQTAMMIIAILLFVTAIAFAPYAIEKYQQYQRDESLECHLWRTEGLMMDISGASRIERLKHELERKKTWVFQGVSSIYQLLVL